MNHTPQDTHDPVERRAGDAAEHAPAETEPAGPDLDIRETDLEPHAGLRYVARLFKVLAILLLLLLVGEVVLGLVQQGQSALPTLLVEATRLVVFAGFLWGAGDMALMLIESNHDLRAARILLGRLNARVQRLVAAEGPIETELPPPGRRRPGEPHP